MAFQQLQKMPLKKEKNVHFPISRKYFIGNRIHLISFLMRRPSHLGKEARKYLILKIRTSDFSSGPVAVTHLEKNRG